MVQGILITPLVMYKPLRFSVVSPSISPIIPPSRFHSLFKTHRWYPLGNWGGFPEGLNPSPGGHPPVNGPCIRFIREYSPNIREYPNIRKGLEETQYPQQNSRIIRKGQLLLLLGSYACAWQFSRQANFTGPLFGYYLAIHEILVEDLCFFSP